MIKIAMLSAALSLGGCALLKDDGWNEMVFTGIAKNAPLHGGVDVGPR